VLGKYHANAHRVKLALNGMRAHTSILCALLLASASSACIEIDGGAVELSWSLRSFDGDRVGSCSKALVEDVRICWQPIADAGTITFECDASQAFPCEEENGVSGFEIHPGATAFWAQPICRDGAPADEGTYQVPPPIVRTVEDGKIVTLNSLLIVVTPFAQTCPDPGCTCVRR
jgi:hypothetical protein